MDSTVRDAFPQTKSDEVEALIRELIAEYRLASAIGDLDRLLAVHGGSQTQTMESVSEK